MHIVKIDLDVEKFPGRPYPLHWQAGILVEGVVAGDRTEVLT
jgi:hypothetical protein